jgi:CelD/BcsL family acetyltransferase involved in cellulose biosynthesis
MTPPNAPARSGSSGTDRTADTRFRAVATFGVGDDAVWDRWRALERDGLATPFQAATVARPLLADLAPALGTRPFVVEVFDAADRHLLSLGLTLRRSAFVRRIEFADFGLIDHNAPVWSEALALDEAGAAALRRAILAALPGHNALLLAKMPPDVGGRPNPLASWPGTTPMSVVTMVYDPAARPLSELSAVKESGRKRRKLAREGGAIRRVDDLDRAHRLLDFAFDLRGTKARRDGRHEAIDTPAVRDFYHTVVAEGLADGAAVVWEVVLGERTIGMVLGLAHAGRFHGTLMATDDDEALTAYSPGMIAVAAVLEDHVAGGGTLFDLGPGEHPYKTRFGAEPFVLVETTRATTPVGLATTADRAFRRVARTWLRRHPALRTRLYRMLGRA